MDQKHQTFTYTARSVEDPDRVITFTLYDSHMQVNLTGLLEQADAISQADDKPAVIKEQIKTQAKPMITKITEEMTEPVHVNDVNATLSDNHLKVTMWRRLAGLRLAPIIFNMGKIDNKTAAEGFVKELEKRQAKEEHAGKFFGPLDYWFGWLGIILAIGFLIRWPRSKND
jgi:hypothetical protein